MSLIEYSNPIEKINHDIKLHKYQSLVFKDLFIDINYRFICVVASRGWGKSYFICISMFKVLHELFMLEPSVPNKFIGLIVPTLEQAKDIYYPILNYQFNLDTFANRHISQQGRYYFNNGVELHFISFEAIERIRGKGYNFLALDEPGSYSEKNFQKAWEGSIKPTITTRWSEDFAKKVNGKPGRALAVGTPKGKTYFYDLYQNYKTLEDWNSYRFTYRKAPLLSREEIEKEREVISELEWKEEYEAMFLSTGLNVFYNFDKKLHVIRELIEPDEEEAIHFCIDFNVAIMATSAFVIRNDIMYFFWEDEGANNTEELAKKIKRTFYNGKRRLYVYPDPTGKARKTSSALGTNDLTILAENKLTVKVKNTSPSIKNSATAVNRRLLTADKKVHMYFYYRLKKTIMSIDKTCYMDNDKAEIDKSKGIEHFSDGVRYATDYLYPVTEKRFVIRGNTY